MYASTLKVAMNRLKEAEGQLKYPDDTTQTAALTDRQINKNINNRENMDGWSVVPSTRESLPLIKKKATKNGRVEEWRATSDNEADDTQFDHGAIALADQERKDGEAREENHMIEEDRIMTMGVFNTRGLRNKLEVVDQLAKDVALLGISETWIKESDKKLKDSFHDSTEPPPVANINRGYSGVGIIINPVLPFEPLQKYSSKTI